MGSASTERARSSFPEDMGFQGTWRTYQMRLLGQLERCLQDNRVHVVAAPGSGKTVFGLEVIRRISRPTLVLAPTVAIRDQWVERLVESFLPPGALRPEWVSTNIRGPRLLTVTTYQALHALCSGERDTAEAHLTEEESATLPADQLDDKEGGQAGKPSGSIQVPEIVAGFKTLVVDEAHHLRAEWWKTLAFVAERLHPTIVALTATPPYDVSPYEWNRYEELCGPVDAEVAVPELVLQGNLCPHQDYVYFSTPAAQEQKTLSEFRAAVEAFVSRLRENRDLTAAIAAHPWITKPTAHMEEILEDPEYASSMVIYLNAIGESIPSHILDLLGIRRKRVPLLDLEWLEILLSHCLYSDAGSFTGIHPVMKAIRNELLQIGAIERRKVVLQYPSDHTRLLTTSKTKLHSIEQIIRLEAGRQGDGLRCVVLTDFIRKAELPRAPGGTTLFEDIGVVPIFETLRRAAVANIRLGILSGSLVFIPSDSEKMVRETAVAIGIQESGLSLKPLAHDPRYSSLELAGERRHDSVRLLTSVFERGGITVLVGTKSLLGEGWDAPAINTLVLASFVGSYMLSNQMRGRSIRIDPNCPSKTANIWHLVCVEPGPFGPGADYEVLVRRCSAFAGVSATGPTIENGADRLGLGQPPFTRKQIEDLNARTCLRALDRDGLRKSWEQALASGVTKQMTDGLKAAKETLPRGFIFANTIASLLIQAGFVFLFVLFEFMRRPLRFHSAQEFFAYAAIIAALAATVSLPWTLRALWRFLRHGTPEGSIRQIGSAVLEALEYEGSIDRHAGEFRVCADRNQDGSVHCWISGGTGRDQAIYLRSLRELLSPVDNPRYILARTRLWSIFREDYFAVPDILARKKEFAAFFASRWNRHVGSVRLVYTRVPEGRKLLLRARAHSLAAAFEKRSERVSCWK